MITRSRDRKKNIQRNVYLYEFEILQMIVIMSHVCNKMQLRVCIFGMIAVSKDIEYCSQALKPCKLRYKIYSWPIITYHGLSAPGLLSRPHTFQIAADRYVRFEERQIVSLAISIRRFCVIYTCKRYREEVRKDERSDGWWGKKREKLRLKIPLSPRVAE